MTDMQSELLQLAQHLKQEKMFVSSEKQHLQALNKKVSKILEYLSHASWIARHQRDLMSVVSHSKLDASPITCCQKANILESTEFLDGYKFLGHSTTMYGEFFQTLRENTQLIAGCLVTGEKLTTFSMHQIISIVISSLYGNSVLKQDEDYILQLMKNLIEVQLVASSNPRKLLRQGSCAFSQLYKMFYESLFSAKLYLTAALHDPVLNVLMDDGVFLDIDPSKAVVRFPPSERLLRFGEEGSEQYLRNLQKYHKWTLGKLVNLTNKFITAIKNNMFCFPQSLLWLVKQVYNNLLRAKKVDVKEVNAVCIDLVFGFFICPAIVNPEPYGIIPDSSISYKAQSNLIQVAQIIQVLAMRRWEDIDPNLLELCSMFDENCLTFLMDEILNNSVEYPVGDLGNHLESLGRSAVLISETELSLFIKFLQEVNVHAHESDVIDKKVMSDLITSVPENIPCNINSNIRKSTFQNGFKDLRQTPLGSKKHILGKGSSARRSRPLSFFHPNSQAIVDEDISESSKDVEDSFLAIEEVLVIPLNTNSTEYVGMLSEGKVLAMEYQSKRNKVRMKLHCTGNAQDGENGNVREHVSHEKRTRFSLSHDDGSIGNTSDNLEAISEAASNHSVSSSVDMENEDKEDNLSELVSANVSGRETPNISGRDTPSSQVTEGDDGSLRTNNEIRPPMALPSYLPVSAPKLTRAADIEDKFGKFEISPLINDKEKNLNYETVSLISDTWSTDVLASDSETVEQCSDRNDNIDLTSRNDPVNQNTLDIAETGSEAWSTDVLASDSERLGEIDTDDTNSVMTARSDDTARSEVGMETDMDPAIDNCRTNYPPDELASRVNNESVPGSPTSSCSLKSNTASNFLSNFSHSSFRPINPVVSMSGPSIVKPTPTKNDKSFEEDLIDMNSDISILVENGTNDHTDEDIASRIPFSAVQSLGRLSLTLGTLPENGVAQNNDSQVNGLVNGSNIRPGKKHNLTYPYENGLGGVSQDIDHIDQGSKEVGYGGGRLSAASVASSSSSGSGEAGPKKSNNDGLTTVSYNSGAIPKSISFDKTAEKGGDRDVFDEDTKNKKSFFKNFKLPFKGRGRKSSPRASHPSDHGGAFPNCNDNDVKNLMDDNQPYLNTKMMRIDDCQGTTESSDEILAKYRKKPSLHLNNTEVNCDVIVQEKEEYDETLSYEVESIDAGLLFNDAKKKLRLVLSTCDVQTIPNILFCLDGLDFHIDYQKENSITTFLKVLLAESFNLQERSSATQLHEAIRCIQQFGDSGCKKLIRALQLDYKARSPYIAYLMRCKQGLLCVVSYLERLVRKVEQDKKLCNKFLVSGCVRHFLEEREKALEEFCKEFQSLTVSDEKAEFVENFFHYLLTEIERDTCWQNMSETQMEMVLTAVERIVMSQIYIYALYPNGDGDVARDQVIHEHMEKLSKIITPFHKDLRIPKVYHYECPWPSAQAEVININAYKTPLDKVQCVYKCCTTIMNVLSMAHDKGTPAADDFVPVLVFVLIKANPHNLLSTVQYVNSFYEKRLEGEERYWWTQFCSAVEFIKTMDYC